MNPLFFFFPVFKPLLCFKTPMSPCPPLGCPRWRNFDVRVFCKRAAPPFKDVVVEEELFLVFCFFDSPAFLSVPLFHPPPLSPFCWLVAERRFQFRAGYYQPRLRENQRRDSNFPFLKRASRPNSFPVSTSCHAFHRPNFVKKACHFSDPARFYRVP